MILMIDSDGYTLDSGNETVEKLKRLKNIGYILVENEKKLEMKNIYGIAFRTAKLNTRIHVVAHIHGKKGNRRPTRYYLFYMADIEPYIQQNTVDIIKILEDFLNDAAKEAKKYDIELIDDYESLFLFENIRKIIDKKTRIINIDKELSSNMNAYFDKHTKPLQFETDDIEHALGVLSGLYGSNFYNCIIYENKISGSYTDSYYKDPRLINIFVLKERIKFESDIIPLRYIGEFQRFLSKNRQDKLEGIAKKIKSQISNVYLDWREQIRDLPNKDKKFVADIILRDTDNFKRNIENDTRTEDKVFGKIPDKVFGKIPDKVSNKIPDKVSGGNKDDAGKILWGILILSAIFIPILIYYMSFDFGTTSIPLDNTGNLSILSNDELNNTYQLSYVKSITKTDNAMLINNKIILLIIFFFFIAILMIILSNKHRLRIGFSTQK